MRCGMVGGCLSKLRGRRSSSLTQMPSGGGSVNWLTGVGPRMGSKKLGVGWVDWGWAQASAVSRPSAETMPDSFMRASHFGDLDGALLVVGLERDRIGGIQRDLVDQLAGVEPRHEHQAARRLVAAARFDAC